MLFLPAWGEGGPSSKTKGTLLKDKSDILDKSDKTSNPRKMLDKSEKTPNLRKILEKLQMLDKLEKNCKF